MLYENKALGISSIISENRQKRPNQVSNEEVCPFCKQNQSAIEQVFMETSTSDADYIRIVNNKYPICQREGDLYGIHDVVIETLEHHKKPYAFSNAHWYELIKLIQLRYIELSKDKRIQFIQIFKNEGREAGASIMHPHWQIVALGQVPLTMQRHYERVEQFYKEKGCLLCQKEKKDALSIIKTKKWRLVVPEEARVPYESWIIPERHIVGFDQIEEKEMKELASLLSETLRLYEQMLPQVSYNICIMSGRPNRDTSYHLYISIMPRTGNFAGFELATGCYINVVSPKRQIARMKQELEHLRGNNLGEI